MKVHIGWYVGIFFAICIALMVVFGDGGGDDGPGLLTYLYMLIAFGLTYYLYTYLEKGNKDYLVPLRLVASGLVMILGFNAVIIPFYLLVNYQFFLESLATLAIVYAFGGGYVFLVLLISCKRNKSTLKEEFGKLVSFE